MTLPIDYAPCPSLVGVGEEELSCILTLGHHGPHKSPRATRDGKHQVREWTDDRDDPFRCTHRRTVVLPLGPAHPQRCRGREGHRGLHWATEPGESFSYRWRSGEGQRTYAAGEPRDLVPGDFALGPVGAYTGENAAAATVAYRRGWKVGSGVVSSVGSPPTPIEDWFETVYAAMFDPLGADHPLFDCVLDGWYDAHDGREDGHSKYCRHHGDGPTECGVA